MNQIKEGEGSDGGESRERACDSLIMCIVTALNQGLRNGGGIGDILRAPSSRVNISFRNFLYFFFKFTSSNKIGGKSEALLEVLR